MNKAKNGTYKKLKELLTQKRTNNNEKIRNIINIYNELGIKEETEKKLKSYFKIAFENLDKIKVSKKNKESIINLARNLIKRIV